MKFSIYQESRKGGRKANQDRIGYSYTRDSLLMMLADGMGGHLHGEVASQIAVQFLTEAFQREARPRLADPLQFLSKSIVNAHHALVDYAKVRQLTDTPRTTCVACVVQEGIAYWAHVGDSRLYHLREGKIQAQTRDHSRVQMLVDSGRIREEAVSAHPDRNKIFNCLGAHTPPQVELSHKTVLRTGDTLLLCSDGLWGPLSGKIIAAALLTGDVLHAVPELLTQAEQRAGKDADNLSVVAMNWTDSVQVQSPGEVSTQTLELDAVITQVEDFKKEDHSDLTDEEIERAIGEIRDAIRKHSPQKP
ncbi:MAG TPA: protein phosphatase 2C domain-containing protein [Burkholderiales bacterium]